MIHQHVCHADLLGDPVVRGHDLASDKLLDVEFEECVEVGGKTASLFPQEILFRGETLRGIMLQHMFNKRLQYQNQR